MWRANASALHFIQIAFNGLMPDDACYPSGSYHTFLTQCCCHAIWAVSSISSAICPAFTALEAMATIPCPFNINADVSGA